MILCNIPFHSRRVLRISLCALALSLPLSASAQTPQGETKAPTSGGGAPATSGAPTGQTPATGAPSSAPVSSSAVVKLKKEIQGDFGYRFVSATGDNALTPLTPLPAATGTDVLVGVPSNVDGKTAKLEVLDNTRGNLARFPIKTDAPLTLNESSFTFAQRINVPVQKGGLGVIGAQVTLTDATKTYNKTTMLQPSDGGLARFDNVPIGKELTATISYGDHKQSAIQTLPASRTGDGWAPISVDWADAKTVTPPAVAASTSVAPPRGESAGSSSHQERSEAQSNTNPISGAINTLISLVFLAGIFYGLYWLYQTGRMKGFLDKLGLSSAALAADGGAAAPSPFDKPAKQPIQPITEGTADPFGGGGAVPGFGAAPAPVASGPRLVATMGTYAGSIFPLQGLSTDIGRDAGNPIPLPNDTNTSRRHATLQMTNGQVALVDNGSSNGTYVNGVRIPSQTPQPLRSGDEVNIGNTRFRFEA